MPAPSAEDVQAYLPEYGSSTPVDIESALAAEKSAQAQVCLVPADDAAWPADLTEALLRRVAANLEVRQNALGVSLAQSEFGVTQVRVGGGDREVNRLEGPYRVIPVA